MQSGFEKFIATRRARSGRWPALSRAREWFARVVRRLAVARLFRQSGVDGERRRIAELESALARTSAALDALTARVCQLQAAVEAATGARNVNLQLPFTQRTQALKMVREGRSAKQIAAALGLPQGEVLLLTRVQEIQPEPPSPPARRNEREASFAMTLRQVTGQAGGAA